MPDPKQVSVDDAQDEGVYGTLHDTIENDAYTVQGQGKETAKREREQLHELKHSQRVGSGDEGDEGDDASSTADTSSSAEPPKTSRTSKTSSSAGGGP